MNVKRKGMQKNTEERKKVIERWKENCLVKHVSAHYFRIHALTCLGRAIVSTKPKGIGNV